MVAMYAWHNTTQDIDKTLMPCRAFNCAEFSEIWNKYFPFEYIEKDDSNGCGLPKINIEISVDRDFLQMQ